MTYSYPESLPEIIEARWHSADLGGLVTAPLPDPADMLALIHVAFQSSLLSEEGRPVSFRLVLCEPDDLADDVELRGRNRPLVFSDPRPLSVQELVRLAPAANPDQTLIGVVKGEDGILAIWGLVDAGLSWWEFVRGERGERLSSSPPPERFTVSSARRGAVTITRGGRVVCALFRGEIVTPSPGDPGSSLDFIGLHPRALRGPLAPTDIFTTGPFGELLRPMAAALREDVLGGLESDAYDPSGRDEDYPRTHLFQFLERVVMRVREAGHGGTLLFVPEDWCQNDARFLDRLLVKYPIDDADTWPTLVRSVRAHRHYYDLLFPAWDSSAVAQEVFRQILYADEEMFEVADLVRDRANLIASLCSVDGGVVLTDRLRILGFGAEIVAQSPTLKHVFVAEDAEAKTGRERPIEDFGTRHRSAFRFCFTHPQVAALVVSQDGDVRAMLRVGPDVVMWPSIAANARE